MYNKQTVNNSKKETCWTGWWSLITETLRVEFGTRGSLKVQNSLLDYTGRSYFKTKNNFFKKVSISRILV